MIQLRLFTWVIISLFAAQTFAAIPIQQSAFEKKNKYTERGVFIGGYDRGLQFLLGMRKNFDKESKVERVVLEMAPQGRLKTERPGFFHISVQKNPQRIIVDLQNVSSSKVDEDKLKKLFKTSEYLGELKIYDDHFTKNLTLEIPLKSQAKVEVFELAGVGQPGRLVIDVKP